MFWADAHMRKIAERHRTTIESGEPLIIRDEKTASGRVHVGSMRGVAIHGAVSEALSERGIANQFIYEINDFDVMDGLPAYLDADTYRPYMGRLLCNVPSPDGEAENFAEYYAAEFMSVIEDTGFYPEFYRSSEVYKSGRMNDAIWIALEHAADIRRIYKEVSGSRKDDDWYPLNVVCEQCGKIGTTKVTGFDGTFVHYECKPDMVEWAEGCGHKGDISPFDGNAKLPWKVEWAAKFLVHGVQIEGEGKDHSTKGGARDIANHIAREIYDTEPPYDLPYEFFLVAGKKMSSSKGAGSSAKEVADLIPSEIFRFALLQKGLKQAFNFDPSGDTIPKLFDAYDEAAEKYFEGVEDDFARLFAFAHEPAERAELEDHFRPRFSQVAFLVQMPHMDYYAELERLKGSSLTDLDRSVANMRADYARRWLAEYADERFLYELQEEMPSEAMSLDDAQKHGLEAILRYIETKDVLNGQELHTKLHEIRQELDIEAKDFFGALYLVLLGKVSGPKAGWFLSVLDRDFLLTRLREAAT